MWAQLLAADFFHCVQHHNDDLDLETSVSIRHMYQATLTRHSFLLRLVLWLQLREVSHVSLFVTNDMDVSMKGMHVQSFVMGLACPRGCYLGCCQGRIQGSLPQLFSKSLVAATVSFNFQIFTWVE